MIRVEWMSNNVVVLPYDLAPGVMVPVVRVEELREWLHSEQSDEGLKARLLKTLEAL